MDPLDSLREMITGILAGISPDARLIELANSPDGKWYTIRLHVQDTTSKPFVVPKTLVQGATHPAYLQTLRNVLRVEVLMQRSRIAVDRSRETLAGLQPETIGSLSSLVSTNPPGESVHFFT